MYEDWWYPVSYIRNGKTVMFAPDDNLKRNPLVIDINPHVPIRSVSLKPSYLWVGDAGQAINIEDLGDIDDAYMSITKDQLTKIGRLHEYCETFTVLPINSTNNIIFRCDCQLAVQLPYAIGVYKIACNPE